MGAPGVDPRLARGSVQHAVDVGVGPVEAAAEQSPEDQRLDDDAADRAGGGLLGAGGDEVAGLTDAEERAVLLAEVAGADEVPPRHGLPLALAAGVAAGEMDEEAVHEVGDLMRGETGPRVQGCRDLVAQPGRRQIARTRWGRGTPQGKVQVRAALVAGEEFLGGVTEIAAHTARTARERDAAHRVGQVPVEAGEEAEAVLAGERSAAPEAEPGTSMERALPPRTS